MGYQSEQELENNLIKYLKSLDYDRVIINNLEDLKKNLKIQLEKLNNITFSDREFNRVLTHLEYGSIYDKAKRLREKFDLERDDGTREYIDFLDMKRWCKNTFQVANQITLEGKYENRYDVTLLINGLPLVQIELKRRGIELKEAFNQIYRYQKHSYKGLFNYIQIFVISNGVDTKYYANNGDLNFKFTFFWKDKDNKNITNLKDFTNVFLERYHIHKMITKYIVLSESNSTLIILRAYQYYAVEAIVNNALHSKKNGYVWHTTGSGKTLTSFKASQILSQNKDVNKVLFIVDRRDLDSQTLHEFNSFEKDSVDGTNNTKKLVRQLTDNTTSLIVTTIQKLAHAVKNNKEELNNVKDKKMILMFDECHRSQFGKMHGDICNFFTNIQSFGFTGTPIFAENANNSKTTRDIFGERLHQYLIKDAINDQNVLGFSVDYIGKFENKTKKDENVKGIDSDEIYNSPIRLEKIVDYIFENHDCKTYNREFTSIFAVSSIDTLNKYYDIFKKKNSELPSDKQLKIATIYSYDANPDIEENDIHPRDQLDKQIADYNQMFGTDYSTDSQSFQLYYQNISKRSKHKEIDILLVVNMFLTGFDNKHLNTLYVDKNLEYHTLLQAYSRTNRIHNEKKAYGNIVCFRNLKKETDEAIRLFSDKNALETVLMKPYEDYVMLFNKSINELFEEVNDIEELNDPEKTELQHNFVEKFRESLRIMNKLKTFTEFSYDNLNISEQKFEDYTSKYLDLYQKRNNLEKKSVLDDIDFEIELIRRDDINVKYILELLKELNPKNPGFKKDVNYILDTMNKDVELKSKKELIDKFIEKTIIESNNNIDIEYKLKEFLDYEKNIAISELIKKEKLDEELTKKIIKDYEFSGKIEKKNKEIDNILIEKLGLSKRRLKREKVKKLIKELVDKFTW